MKYSFKKVLFLLIILLSVFLIFSEASAFSSKFFDYLGQSAGPSGANYSASQASESFINTKIGQIVGGIVGLIGIIFLGLTVYSGIQWMTAGGNEETVTKSKKRVINGTIGVGLTLSAFLLANLYFSFFEQKFLSPGALSNVNVAPYGFQNAPCQTDPQCADRTGPTTGQPMTCYIDPPPNGICGECGNNSDCPNLYECDLPTHLCIPAQNLTCAQLTPMGPGQCIFDPNCKWVPNPTQTEWNVGSCVDNSASPCPQCTENQPFCCPSCPPLPANSCVECTTGANCATFANWCQTPPGGNYTCAF